mgnify:FL=1
MIPNGHITIYNRYFVNRVETYQRTVIRDVVWQATKAVSGRSTGVLASNVATVFIPMARGADYLKPKAWQAARSGKWTLQEGDVIVRGEATDNITTEYTITSLRAEYEDVVTITSVDAMDQGSANVQHWQVGCK